MSNSSFRTQENIYKDYVNGEPVPEICKKYNIELKGFLSTMFCLGGDDYNPNKWDHELMEYIGDKR